MEKVNEFIRQEVSMAILELQNEKIGLVTVTSVETKKDLKKAIVYVSILGPHRVSSFEELKRKAGEIQHMVNRNFNFKNTPRVEFKYDSSGEYAEKIENMIREIKEEKR